LRGQADDALPVVTFVARTFADKWTDAGSAGLPDAFPERIRSGVEVWIVSTYLELRARAAQYGFRVAANSRFPAGLPVVAHRDDLRLGSGHWQSFVAAVRADRPPVHLAPLQVVQNPDQQSAFATLIPSWPQPGLRKRDSLRAGISVLGYFGRASSLPAFLRDESFLAELRRRGIAFRSDEREWRDYSGTDVCIGLRFEPEIGLATKPFVKLTNAWLAEVPALLGPEPAYRALRKSSLDYIEVSSARDVLDALDGLRSNPELYAAMVENGRKRGSEFTRDAVAARWCEFISATLLPAWRSWRANREGPLRGWSRLGIRLARQWRETRRYKRIEAGQLAQLRRSGAGERMDR
jgi:hypothetical protein